MTMQLSKAFELISDKKVSLKSLIADAIQSAKTMKQKVQIAAVASLWHIEKHGNWNVANHAINQLTKELGENGVRANALIEWYVQFGGLKYNTETKQFDGFQGAEYIREHFQNAQKTIWDSMRPEPEYTGFDLNAQLQKLLDKAINENVKRQKLMDKGDAESIAKAEKIAVDGKMVETLQMMVNKNADTVQMDGGAPKEERKHEQFIKKDEKVVPKNQDLWHREHTYRGLIAGGHYQPVVANKEAA